MGNQLKLKEWKIKNNNQGTFDNLTSKQQNLTSHKTNYKSGIKDIVQSLLVAFILALIVRAYLVQAFSIPSESMLPTLKVGDMLLADKIIFKFRKPHRGEIIIFKYPYSIYKKYYLINFFSLKVKVPDFIRKKKYFNFVFFKIKYPSFLYGWKDYIKRVVAVEGDKIFITKGKVFLNDKEITEPYIAEKPMYSYGPKIVPKNCVLVLGDNRNNSQDGHIWGFLNLKYLRANPLFIYWPPQRIGLVK